MPDPFLGDRGQALSDWRPGQATRERRPGVPGPDRRPGQDPRIPHRARRDRGRARRRIPTWRNAWSSRARTSRSDKRLVAYVVAATRATRPPRSSRPTSEPSCRSTWCRPIRAARHAAAHAKRQGRPQGTPRAGPRPRGQPRGRSSRRGRRRKRRSPTVWAAVLGVPRVGVDDNFFELGGDSILTIQVITRCRQAGLQFTPHDLAKHPSLAALAEVVAPAAPSTHAEPEEWDGAAGAHPDPELVLRTAVREPALLESGVSLRGSRGRRRRRPRAGARPRRRSPRRASPPHGRGQPGVDVDLRPERARPVDRADRSHPDGATRASVRHRDHRRHGPGGAPPGAWAAARGCPLRPRRGARTPSPRHPPPRRGRRLLESPDRGPRACLPRAPGGGSGGAAYPLGLLRALVSGTDGLRVDGRAGQLPGRLAEHRRGGRDPADGRLGARREHGGHGANGDGVTGSRRDPSPAPAGSGGVPHADQRRPSRRLGACAPRLDGP